MNNSIRELRKALGLSQDEFAGKLGLTRGAITNIELHKTKPKPLLVDLICATYNVNAHWLRTGEGEMFPPRTEKDELSAFYETMLKENGNSPKRRLLLALSRLDDAQWQILMNLAKAMADEE